MKSINHSSSRKSKINNRVLPFIAFLLFVGLSCNTFEEAEIPEQSISETEQFALQSATEQVALHGIANAPEESGFFVVRFEGIQAYTVIDPKSQLILTINYPDRLPSYCGGGLSMDLLNTQLVFTGNNEQRALAISQGEVEVKVFQGPFVFDNNLAEFCTFLVDAPLLAEGKANFEYHDNDLFLSSGPNQKNAFGFSVQGQLTTPEGAVKHLSAGSNFLWPKDAENVTSILDVLKNVHIRLK